MQSLVEFHTPLLGDANLSEARMGAKVYLACRRVDAAEEAKQDIIKATGNSDLHIIRLDLSNFASIREFVAEMERREPEGVHVLVNNAGYVTQHNTVKINGVMEIFAINQLGPFLLTNLLLSSIKVRIDFL